MDYQISETERNSLATVRDQLDLICGCLSLGDGHLQFVSSHSLNIFLDERSKEIGSILAKLEERHDAEFEQAKAREQEQKQADGSIPPALLVRIIEVCSGVSIDEAAVAELHAELYEVLGDDITPLSAFYAALSRQGYEVSHSVNNDVSHFIIRKPASNGLPKAANKPRTAPRKRDRLAATTA